MLGTVTDSPFPLHGPWRAQSPTTGRMTDFDDAELWAECERQAREAVEGGRFTVGAALYQQVPLCAHPGRLRDPDAARWLEDWQLSRALGVPVARTLGEVDADFAEAAPVIEREVAAALEHKRSKA